MKFGFLAQRLFNRPLALLPAQADVMAHLLRAGFDEAALLGPDSDDKADRVDSYVAGGVCVIPVRGVLLSGDGWSWYGATYYGAIRRALASALSTETVRGIVLLIDSPGGLVTGCFDLADAIYAMRGSKPIWAILDESAYSAAYALASACDRVWVPRTGGTGSIGVIDMHVDITAALEKGGVEVTMIQYGARKTDRYATTPLTKQALAAMQADVDAIGELFVATVARNRGLKSSAVRGTEAGTFLGAAGVEAGLADAVASPDEAFLALVEQLS